MNDAVFPAKRATSRSPVIRRPLDCWNTETVTFAPLDCGTKPNSPPRPLRVKPTDAKPALAAHAAGVEPPPPAPPPVPPGEAGSAGQASKRAFCPRATNTGCDFSTAPAAVSHVSV